MLAKWCVLALTGGWAGEKQMVQELATRGADILARTCNTNLALDEATGSHHWKTASVLKHLMGPSWYNWARYSFP